MLLLLCLCFGCSLLRKSSKETTAFKSENNYSSASNEQQELKKEVYEKTLVLTKDSAGSELTTIIWPHGSFRFSPESGFTGEADQIQLTHKKSTKSENLKQAETHVQTDSTTTRKTSSKSSAGIAKQSKKPVETFNYFLAIVLLMSLAMAYILIPKLRKWLTAKKQF